MLAFQGGKNCKVTNVLATAPGRVYRTKMGIYLFTFKKHFHLRTKKKACMFPLSFENEINLIFVQNVSKILFRISPKGYLHQPSKQKMIRVARIKYGSRIYMPFTESAYPACEAK